MQATITYLLSEQAQRAQMAATGQPVARKQTTTEEVPSEYLASPYCHVDEAGLVTFDLTKTMGIGRDGKVIGYGGSYAAVYAPLDQQPVSGLAALETLTALVAAKCSEIEAANAAAQIKALEKQEALEARCNAAVPFIQAFLSDPAMMPVAIDSGYLYWIEIPAGNTTLTLHRDWWYNEKDIVALANIGKERIAAAAEAKSAKEAAKEAAKLEYLKTWIAEHGSESQRARNAEGLLPRGEAIKELVDATFASIGYHVRHKTPEPDCDSEDCDECEIKRGVDDEITPGLTENQYDTYNDIRKVIAVAVNKAPTYVFRMHKAWHDCDHDACKAGINYGLLVKITVGPFVLQREYAL